MASEDNSQNENVSETSTINQGLEGVVVAQTCLSRVDGIKGELIYSKYLLEEIIERTSCYEDVLYLLLYGDLPTENQSKAFIKEITDKRTLSADVEAVIDVLPKGLDYMDAFKTGISVLGCEIDTTYPPTPEQALQIIAKAPIIVSRYYRRNTGQEILQSNPAYSHVANYLYLLTGNTPDSGNGAAYAHALDMYFITTIEHGMNASTFTARVATSTKTDLISAIVAAISTLKGPLHGGAPSEVIHMLNEIGTKENAEPWMRQVLDNGGRLMGFGHRVYKTYDPRAKALQEVVAHLPSDDGNTQLDLSRHVEKVAIELFNEYKPGRNLYTNVEFAAASVLRSVGLPAELYPTTFGVARCGGWVAHAIEQAKNNRLIRPSAQYIGELPESHKSR